MKVGDTVFSVCHDWEHANPMKIVEFSFYGQNPWDYDVVCIGSDGNKYQEVPEAWVEWNV